MLFSPSEPYANYLVASSNAVMIVFLCINAQNGFKMELPDTLVVKASTLAGGIASFHSDHVCFSRHNMLA